MIVIAHKLWYDGEIAVGMCEFPINCDQLVGGTPRDAYLVPASRNCTGPFYNLSLSRPIPYPAATLQGVWIELRGGSGMMVDALSAHDIINACDGCCGTAPVIAGRYNGNIPSPPEPVAATYTFTRTDAETWYAYYQASTQYYPQYIPGTFNRISYAAGVSTYQFQAYKDPIYMAGDTQTAETPRVFTSNVAPSLPAGSEYTLTVSNEGINVTPMLAAATLALLVTAAQGNTAYSSLGTWATANNQITLTSTTVNLAQLTIGTQVIP